MPLSSQVLGRSSHARSGTLPSRFLPGGRVSFSISSTPNLNRQTGSPPSLLLGRVKIEFPPVLRMLDPRVVFLFSSLPFPSASSTQHAMLSTRGPKTPPWECPPLFQPVIPVIPIPHPPHLQACTVFFLNPLPLVRRCYLPPPPPELCGQKVFCPSLGLPPQLGVPLLKTSL